MRDTPIRNQDQMMHQIWLSMWAMLDASVIELVGHGIKENKTLSNGGKDPIADEQAMPKVSH